MDYYIAIEINSFNDSLIKNSLSMKSVLCFMVQLTFTITVSVNKKFDLMFIIGFLMTSINLTRI